jgi:TatA/E family protein of Tat protein translocase
MSLLFFEFLGTSELMVILVAALILFGPRKLPDISRQIGKSLSEFKRASEDFRQTWENEVQKEFSMKDAEIDRAMLPEEETSATNRTIGRGSNSENPAWETEGANSTPAAAAGEPASAPSTETNESESGTRKRDWL